ncbi:centromere protein V-like [Panulirus ornatus]|uniref:centromere protein V-like n=1 Tax=Panulirus ornatus TaxID=150431 RepID=UPI003A852106
MDRDLVRHHGGCHCGSVRFEVLAPAHLTVIDCNCSICVKKQNKHFIVPLSHFKLVKGHDILKTYTFNTHKAKHNFCSNCGVQPFYIPRSNPDGYGIAPHCLDEGTVKKITHEKFDGKNWEKTIEKKSHIINYSKDNKK